MSDAATAARMAGLRRDWRARPWDEVRPIAGDGEAKDTLPRMVGFSYPCDDGSSALQHEGSQDSAEIGGSRLDGGSGNGSCGSSASCGESGSGGTSGSGGEEAPRTSAHRGASLLSLLLVHSPAKRVVGINMPCTSSSPDGGAGGNAKNAPSRASPRDSRSGQPHSQLVLDEQPHSAGAGGRGGNPQGFQCAPSRAVPSRSRTGPVEERGGPWHGTPRSQPIDVPRSTYLQDPEHIQELNLLQTLRLQHRAQIEAGLRINSATQAADRAAAAAAAAAAYAAAAKVMVEAGKLAPAAAMAAANAASDAAAVAKAKAADVQAVVTEASTLVAQEMDAAGAVMTALQLG